MAALNSVRFRVAELIIPPAVGALLSTILVTTDTKPGDAAWIGVAGLIATALGMVLVAFAWSFVRAPYRLLQEATDELALREIDVPQVQVDPEVEPGVVSLKVTNLREVQDDFEVIVDQISGFETIVPPLREFQAPWFDVNKRVPKDLDAHRIVRIPRRGFRKAVLLVLYGRPQNGDKKNRFQIWRRDSFEILYAQNDALPSLSLRVRTFGAGDLLDERVLVIEGGHGSGGLRLVSGGDSDQTDSPLRLSLEPKTRNARGRDTGTARAYLSVTAKRDELVRGARGRVTKIRDEWGTGPFTNDGEVDIPLRWEAPDNQSQPGVKSFHGAAMLDVALTGALPNDWWFDRADVDRELVADMRYSSPLCKDTDYTLTIEVSAENVEPVSCGFKIRFSDGRAYRNDKGSITVVDWPKQFSFASEERA